MARYRNKDVHHLDETALTPTVSEALPPRVIDPVVTLSQVKEFVEADRRRNRRILIWTYMVFLFIVLSGLTAFVSVSIVVMRRSRHSAELAELAREKADTYAASMTGLSGEVQSLSGRSEEVIATVAAHETKRQDEGRVLQGDLGRFSQWVSTRTLESARAAAKLEERLRELEAAIQSRDTELNSLRTRPTAQLAQSPSPSPTPERSEARDRGSPHSVVQFPNGDRFEGEMKDGVFHGWGAYTYGNGDRYEGAFRHDTKCGRGSLAFHNGDLYTGAFTNDLMNGRGTLIYHNGNKYVGGFKDGLRHGDGVLYFENGDVYKGAFEADARTGSGTYIFSDGAKYVGEFRDGKRHGRGRYIYPGGEEYVGAFRHGKKHGEGVCVYPNGVQLKGFWEDDKFVENRDG